MSRKDWFETTATVYSCGWEDTPERGFVFRSLTGLFSGRYLIVFSYAANGNHYSGEFTSSQEWKEGSSFSLSYNPGNPAENDRSDDGENIGATIGAWIGGILLAAALIWWKSRK